MRGILIFVVRDENNITFYGGNYIYGKTTSDYIMHALTEKQGLCCFIAKSNDENDFEVTHVIVPYCNITKKRQRTLGGAPSYGGSTTHCKGLHCTHPAPKNHTYFPVTLSEFETYLNGSFRPCAHAAQTLRGVCSFTHDPHPPKFVRGRCL